MTTDVLDLQRRLLALGFSLPKYGADGDPGDETVAAMSKALDELVTRRAGADPVPAPAKPGPATLIPADWMPDAKMQRVIVHWTAGTHTASETDRGHYHVLIEGSGKPIRGKPSIKLNEAPAKTGYAAHTLNCNSGSIGVSMCCMGGAIESPFSAGKYPMTRAQWDAMTSAVADLCRRYSIPVTDKTVLSHAEVQNNLGIAQRGKWDFTRLAFNPSAVGAKACGDKMRAEVHAKLS
ncbi:N-acetylmuramoyl-L-alanine amidase [Rhizobium sp. TRM96647]|uniref:peptidoglycan recognition protein family protein n=1 Tax=unclassified Rhizobium TaxID=2613769 RepID=UPI0021E8C6D5|nr:MULTISPECIES: N-acetylmuramoyl-L-alanine amidase [unclassified Rhizobium]MCV3738393.1 N-acetylmuramoyl-L-alanine amidase [Rhizobium sp. TRM96647]MCV3759858.1 N-acetylmuramoyl-L-alanine amidase [Rhizobium sp. TRM96650]